jgi:spore maturation protein SpmA
LLVDSTVDLTVDTLKVALDKVDSTVASTVDTVKVALDKVDSTVDTVKVAMARADSAKVVGDQELLNTVVSKITGMQVNRLLDMIKCFKAKAWLTKWVQAAAMVVVTAADTVVLATVQ